MDLSTDLELGQPEYVSDPPRPQTDTESPVAKAEYARKQKIVDSGLARYKLAVEAYGDQIREELADLEFEGGDQWDSSLRKAREGGIAPDGRAVPPKPCLQFNKLDPTIQQVLNEARQGRFSIQIKPKAGEATQEVAKVRQGLIRAIEVDSNAANARMWGLDRSVKCGRGAWRVLKVQANDGDFDMDLQVSRILNQHSVHFDPFAQQPDWSDGEWCLITSDIPAAEFARRWPDSELNEADTEKLKSIGDAAPDWIGEHNGAPTFRVAEYFYVIHKTRTLIHLPQTGNLWLDDLSKDAQETAITMKGFRRRAVDIRSVKWCVITAVDVLDEEDWEGRYIPVIPVIGKEYNIGGKRRWKGIVNNAKDAQRAYNYMRSKQMETIGVASLSPWVMAEGQDAGYEHMWDQANTTAFTRLVYNPRTFEGNLLPPPQRDVAEPPVQAITLAAHEADADIKATMGRYDPSLGKPGSDRSGKAIKELKVQGETGTSNYTENFALAMTYEGKVLNNMLKYVYDTPGRIVKIIGDEENESEVMLNQPYENGPNGMRKLAPGEPFDALRHKEYNLDDGEFSVVVSVGKSFQTRREEATGAMTELAQAAPELVPQYADLWVSNMDFPGAEAISKRLKKMNPAAKEDDATAPPIPPEIQAQMSQVQQQLAQATQVAQALQHKIDSDQPKYDAQIAMKEAELASRERIAQINGLVQLKLAAAKLSTDKDHLVLRAQIDELARNEQHEQSMELAALTHSHSLEQDIIGHTADQQSQLLDQAHQHTQGVLDRHATGVQALINKTASPPPTAPDPTQPEPMDLAGA